MENYDDTKESNYITYQDANNLYGWAMSENLPYDEVKINTDITIMTMIPIIMGIMDMDTMIPSFLTIIMTLSTVEEE